MAIKRYQLLLFVTTLTLLCPDARAEPTTYNVIQDQSWLTKWNSLSSCTEGCSFAVSGSFDAELAKLASFCFRTFNSQDWTRAGMKVKCSLGSFRPQRNSLTRFYHDPELSRWMNALLKSVLAVEPRTFGNHKTSCGC